MAGPARPLHAGALFFAAARLADHESMNSSLDAKPSGWSGLILSQLLSLALLAGCLWWVVREAELILPNDQITASLSVEQNLGTDLPRQLFAFGAALLLCHALLGLAAFGLARLTEAHSPAAACQARLAGRGLVHPAHRPRDGGQCDLVSRFTFCRRPNPGWRRMSGACGPSRSCCSQPACSC